MVNYTPRLFRAKVGPVSREVLVRDIMHKAFVSFRADMDILEASKMLLKHRITGAPVINEEKEALGFLSEKDCLRFTMNVKYHNNEPGYVGDYMSRTIISLPPSSDIYYATDLFTKNPFYSYPVVENDIVVGVVYRHSVLEALFRMAQATC